MMRPALLLATQNAKKRKELEALTQDSFRVLTLDDMDLCALEIEENGDTFEANAAIKAHAVLAALNARAEGGAQRVDGPIAAVLADDSGICVDALAGAPGVRSARFAEDHGAGRGDADNNRLLLQKLRGVPAPARSARFVCAICLLTPDGTTRFAFGEVEGHIAEDERGEGGFGYDPLFCPVEAPGKRMAELTASEKHAISHRGHAIRRALQLLAEG